MSPGFPTVAIFLLALGVGANAAIFQLFDAVRVRVLPVKDPQQLVEVALTKATRGHRNDHFSGRRSSLTYAQWEQIRARQQVFSGIVAGTRSKCRSEATQFVVGSNRQAEAGRSIQQANAQPDVISPAVFQSTVPPVYEPENVKNYLKFRLGASPAEAVFLSQRLTGLARARLIANVDITKSAFRRTGSA